MTLLGDAISIHLTAQQAVAGVDVVYSQGGTTVTPTAVKGATRQQDLDATGAIINVDYQDWIIPVAEMAGVVPQRGDTITEGSDEWECMGAASDGPPFEYLDQFHTAYRIHSQRVTAS